MADYTTELRKLADWPVLADILTTYPIYDESNRNTLNQLFWERYYFREIGFETPEMFAQRLRAKLLDIMPMYNQLFESAAVKYGILDNIDVETDGAHSAESSTSTESGSRAAGTTLTDGESVSDQLDMPQTQLDQEGDYLTSRGTGSTTGKTVSDQETNETGTSGSTTAGDTRSVTKGRSGVSGADMVLRYRQAIINVNSLIVDELGELFMMVWRPVNRWH